MNLVPSNRSRHTLSCLGCIRVASPRLDADVDYNRICLCTIRSSFSQPKTAKYHTSTSRSLHLVLFPPSTPHNTTTSKTVSFPSLPCQPTSCSTDQPKPTEESSVFHPPQLSKSHLTLHLTNSRSDSSSLSTRFQHPPYSPRPVSTTNPAQHRTQPPQTRQKEQIQRHNHSITQQAYTYTFPNTLSPRRNR